MKVFALYNMKGGVGKTTSAVNLAYLSAIDGARTLLWDLDPQASATFYLRVAAYVEGGGRALLDDEADIDAHIRGSDFEGLDVLPADFSYRKLEATLAQVDAPSKRLRRALAPLSEQYEHVFLDCVPNVSRLSAAVLAAADVLLIPTIPTTLSMRALARQMAYFKKQEKRRFRALPFFSMVDRRKALHRSVCAWVHGQELGFLRTEVPYSSVVERMGVQRQPVPGFAAASKPGRAYRLLWDEVLARTSEPAGKDTIYPRKVRERLADVARTDPRELPDVDDRGRGAGHGPSPHRTGRAGLGRAARSERGARHDDER